MSTSEPSLHLDTNLPFLTRPASVVTGRPSPVTALTTFPNPFADEPEPGLIPSLLSKLQSTFSGAPAAPPATATPAASGGGERVRSHGHGQGEGSAGGAAAPVLGSVPEVLEPSTASIPTSPAPPAKPTEAQLIAAAVKERNLTLKHGAAQSQSSQTSVSIIGPGTDSVFSRSSAVPSASTSVATSSSPQKGNSGNRSLKPPASARSSQSVSSKTPSLASAALSHTDSRRLVPPAERQWRPSGVAPAQVTISPVTSVTTTITGTNVNADAGPSRSTHQRAHFAPSSALTQVVYPPVHAHSQARVPSPQLRRHAQRDSLSSFRPRRSSFATIPDSPSSVSLSAMIHNAELSQNVSYVPGFPLGQDDTRSVRSLALVKKSNSVSKIIRRMRGEGLSKHYWMLDEHCKECYDCKSSFTAWRRKHHCRICGQIFCSRCASNIIGARRFGQDGAVRVCNLCLKIMEEYRDDDDADRRSINSVATSARLPSSADRLMDVGISPDLPYSKSPFAASQLFSSNPDDALGAIEEGVQTQWEDGRPYTPRDSDDDDDDSIYDKRPTTAVPFRRPMEEDSSAPGTDSAPGSEQASPDLDAEPPSPGLEEQPPNSAPARPRINARPSERRKRVEFPRTETMSSDGVGEMRNALTRVDSNQPLIGLRTRLSSRASQGGLTSLIDAEKSEGLWRARSNSFVKRPELIAGASLQHFHLILEQAIARASLPNPDEWHRVLSDILLKVSTHVNPNVRAGDSIDVRAYVKIKKVPGGKISESEYVDGIVISKNVAHKAMPRRLVNPRIMVVTFPLDYHRIENQFMSLDPIMAQEKDYLRLLTRRIIDVRPHIVLVERSASRLALDHLLEAGIAVARCVKLSAIHQVARCTQADVVASMDRLALEPRLGRCAEFRIQSFDHELIPGRRKTLMRFEGCLREYGCTIVLRGGDIATLRKVKHIADFMSLVVYHLKNEIILYNDEHNILPIRPPLRNEYQQLLAKLAESDAGTATLLDSTMTVTPDSPTTPIVDTPLALDDERAIERRDAKRRTREIALSIEPYLTTVLSSSVSIRLPPPAPLAKMAELDILLRSLRRQRDEDETREILQEERKEPPRPLEIDTALDAGDPQSIPPVPPPTAASQSKLRDPYRVLRRPDEISRDSTIAQVEHAHTQQLRLWQWYMRRHQSRLCPEDFQNLIYLFSLGCEGSEKPCVEPTLQHINFYQPGDATLGQFLETLALDAAKPCPNKACERLLLMHFRLLVHGDRRLQIAMDQFPCPSPGHEDRIITWSYCRVCGAPSPTTIMRDETWKMSWGAYLEHCFYPPATSAGFACSHDAFRDQIRYFAHRNLAIRIHNEPIELYNPVRPSITLQCKAETKVTIKNQEYEVALQKNAAFFDSVLFRLRSFDYDICHPDKIGQVREAMEALLMRAVADREELVNLLNRTYKLTPMTDVLALNTVLRTLQDKVVQWDTDFADVEKTYLPSEKDLRRMTASHLKRLFASQDGIGSLDRSVAGLTVSEADEKEPRLDGENSASSSMLSTPIDGVSGPPSVASSSSSLIVDDGVTPTATVAERQRNPLSAPTSPGGDSDSTIGKNDGRRPTPLLTPGIESSEMDSDAYFGSRIPRRTKPAASIADLVKRFQDSAAQFEAGEDVTMERPRSSGSVKRTYHHEPEPSDSDSAIMARPRLRRGKTDQPMSTRPRDPSMRAGMISDADRSYALNASRAPHSGLKRNTTIRDNRPPLQHRASGLSAKSPTGSGRNSPDPAYLAAPTRPSVPRSDSKSRLSGKGRAPRSGELKAPPASRPGNRRSMTATPANRVTSIARHFDRLSRDAERERQKRNAVMRNKRARPVAATKVKVQVFNNVRDAFRDESDSDSSEADNEEDDAGSDDDADSDREPRSSTRKPSPSKSPKKSPTKPALNAPETPPIPVATVPADSDISMPISESGGSIASSSVISDARSEMSFTDRLKIDLPSFETSAPLPSVPATPQLSIDTADESGPGGHSQISQMSESELSSGGERSSILKTLTGLWAFRAGDYTPLEYPLSAAEHIFADSRVIIRENEPTSIIAFTLSSKMYRDKMKNATYAQSVHSRNEAFMPDEASIGERNSTWDMVSLDEAVDADDPYRREGATHLKYDFDSGSSNIFCRIFFAEQFAALRSACQCEDSFVESLARCVQFDASGGKSGSAFLKTKDDRFICKEISRLEMDALTKFAPAYFEYTKKAFQGQRPTVLAKIYGFFKIGYRNAVTGRAMRMNVLVMENLFYERRFTKIYDLKGSTRNRLIQATGKVNEVLLDENLMEIVYKHPLYLREHSKRILRTALFNDTLFLSNLNVMDYSLVVGVDAEKGELVVGIVDYIRTFTWDKKLESWVKDSAFLGGAGKGEPTIVTPKQYKARFRAAMERYYFPSVPDRWSQIGSDETAIEEEVVGSCS